MTGDGIRTCRACGQRFPTNRVIAGCCPLCAPGPMFDWPDIPRWQPGLIASNLYDLAAQGGHTWCEDVRPKDTFL